MPLYSKMFAGSPQGRGSFPSAVSAGPVSALTFRCPNPVGLIPVGLNPVGLHPVDLIPVGLNPVRLNPVGLNPVGLIPVGPAESGPPSQVTYRSGTPRFSKSTVLFPNVGLFVCLFICFVKALI